MIDPQWFLNAMMGDNIILRLQLTPLASKRTRVKAVAYAYWMDDAAPIGAAVWYESDLAGEKFKPLRLMWLQGSVSDWMRDIAAESEGWPPSWQQDETVVCTRGSEGRVVIPPSRPEVLHHLARFEGLALEAERHADAYEAITYRIVAARLSGIVHAGVAGWARLLEQH